MMEQVQKKPKMMQVNVMDNGQGKLTINIRRHGFSDTEAIGVLEMAKVQVQGTMRTKLEHSARFKPEAGDGKQ